MNIHEYQGKEILRHFGVSMPRSIACFSVAEAVVAAQQLGGRMKGEGDTGSILDPLGSEGVIPSLFPLPQI